MGYGSWLRSHAKKHRQIMQKLQHLTKEEVIVYFQFENMVQNEPDFCPLYKENRKCHEMELLNCYLCACPNFRFNDSGIKKEGDKTLYSYCSIDSKKGGRFISEDAIHQDCSQCLIPHKEAYIMEHFDRDWLQIMKHTDESSSNSV
jgi:hypothetical protein